MALNLIGESVDDFLNKYGLKNLGCKCVNCGKDVKYNKVWYEDGHAVARFEHDCPENFWVTSFIPISKKEKEHWGLL